MTDALKIKNLETCLTLAIALVVVFLWKQEILFLYAAIAMGLIGLLVPVLANAIRWGWFKLAELLGAVTSRILLALVFFSFLTPIAWLYRRFKKNTFDADSNANTYWTSRDHIFTPKDLQNPW